MFIDKFTMQNILAGKDEGRFYHICLDISLSGEKYKVQNVTFFAREPGQADDFLCVTEYKDSLAVLTVETADPEIISEGVQYLLRSDAAEYELRTNCDILSLPCIADNFEIGDDTGSSPTYSLRSADELVDIPAGDVEISLLTKENSEAFREILASEHAPYADCFADIRRYGMTKDRKPIGYLRAERGYKNYYDIGWLYVLPGARGHGYAPMLVSYFAKDCLENGAFPNYGYAVSRESERVAEKCGFSKDEDYRLDRQLIKK